MIICDDCKKKGDLVEGAGALQIQSQHKRGEEITQVRLHVQIGGKQLCKAHMRERIAGLSAEDLFDGKSTESEEETPDEEKPGKDQGAGPGKKP